MLNVKILSIIQDHIIIQRVRSCNRLYYKKSRVIDFYIADLIRRDQEK